MILLTGAGGMLGHYIRQVFQSEEIVSLGRKEDSECMVDLTREAPDFGSTRFSLVVHAAGTESEEGCMELNWEGTKRLLSALEKNPPDYFVYMSSGQVYSRDAGENIDEETNTWATSQAGKSKALAENSVREWCEVHNVTLTILRPARMFGNRVGGETLRLFNDALEGKYIHIRGNDAKVSLVCALDVARGLKKLYKIGGVYNVADPFPVRFIDLVEAMTANAGAKKRMTHLPAAWAEWLWRLARWIPSIDRNLRPDVVEKRMKTLTLDGSKFADIADISYHNTLAVIELTDQDYPYSEVSVKKKVNVREF